MNESSTSLPVRDDVDYDAQEIAEVKSMAITGHGSWPWVQLRTVLLKQLDKATEHYVTALSEVETDEFKRTKMQLANELKALDRAPFTTQRMCELLLEPDRHYRGGGKFLNALEKVVRVNSPMPADLVNGTEVAPATITNGTEAAAATTTNGTEVPPATTTNGTEVPPATTTNGTEVPPVTTTNGTEVPPVTTANGTEVPPVTTANDTEVPPATATSGTKMAPAVATNGTEQGRNLPLAAWEELQMEIDAEE